MQEDIKRFGFGFMRLPFKKGEIDYEKTNEMVDEFISRGGTNSLTQVLIISMKKVKWPLEKLLLRDIQETSSAFPIKCLSIQ